MFFRCTSISRTYLGHSVRRSVGWIVSNSVQYKPSSKYDQPGHPCHPCHPVTRARKVLENARKVLDRFRIVSSLSTVKCGQLSRPAALAHPPTFGELCPLINCSIKSIIASNMVFVLHFRHQAKSLTMLCF